MAQLTAISSPESPFTNVLVDVSEQFLVAREAGDQELTETYLQAMYLAARYAYSEQATTGDYPYLGTMLKGIRLACERRSIDVPPGLDVESMRALDESTAQNFETTIRIADVQTLVGVVPPSVTHSNRGNHKYFVEICTDKDSRERRRQAAEFIRTLNFTVPQDAVQRAAVN